MKQRITIDDLNQLSDKQKDKLREWWQPEYGDFICSLETKREGLIDNEYITVSEAIEMKDKLTPLLSIGQMIELVELHNVAWIARNCVDYDDRDFEDALWDKIKEVL